MTATQTRIRRGTGSEVRAGVPASSEIWHDTTNSRLHLGNGSTAGGILIPNRADLQTSALVYKAAGGTANALTVTLDEAPAAYVAGMRVIFKAASANTGAATINVNALGIKNLTRQAGGTISALTGGEIISGGMYEVLYDGSQFQLVGLAPPEAASSGLDLLSVATASGSASLDFTGLSSTYINYLFAFSGLLLSSYSAILHMRLSQGGSFKAGVGDYASLIDGKVITGTDAVGRNGSTSVLDLSDNLTADSCHHGGVVNLSAPAGKYPTICGQSTKIPASGGGNLQAFNFYGALVDATSQVDGARFFPSAGTITSGTIYCYGLRSSL